MKLNFRKLHPEAIIPTYATPGSAGLDLCARIPAKGERVAQIVLQQVPLIEWDPVGSVDLLGDSERGANGFGSTGCN